VDVEQKGSVLSILQVLLLWWQLNRELTISSKETQAQQCHFVLQLWLSFLFLGCSTTTVTVTVCHGHYHWHGAFCSLHNHVFAFVA